MLIDRALQRALYERVHQDPDTAVRMAYVMGCTIGLVNQVVREGRVEREWWKPLQRALAEEGIVDPCPALTDEEGALTYDTLRRLGRYVREERERRILTKHHLAKLAGVTVYSLTKIEQGDRNMRLLYVLRVARYLEIPLSEILDG